MTARPDNEETLREVSPEEHQQMISSKQVAAASKTRKNYASLQTPTVATAVIAFSVLIGFFVGILYQKSKTVTPVQTAATSSTQNRYGQFGSRGARRAGAIGQVTAIDSSSLTLQNARTGASQTFKITSATVVSNNGASAGIGDIKSGDTVTVRTSSTDTTTAVSIFISSNTTADPTQTPQIDSPTNSSDTTTNPTSTTI